VGEEEVSQQIGELTGVIRELVGRIDEGRGKARNADGGREAAARDGIAEQAKALTAIDQEKLDAAVSAAVKAQLAQIRTPSMAAAIGQGKASTEQAPNRLLLRGGMEPHAGLKANFRDYIAGELVASLGAVRDLSDGYDPERVAWGKAKLAELGITRFGVADGDNVKGYFTLSGEGKATLGATGATGGYVLPNNLVDALIKPNVQAAVYTAGANPLVTVVPGVAVRGVDQPYRTGSPTKLVPQDWGATKENVNEAYGSYTATLATFARIYDTGKQYLRFSAGSAERDVIDELTKAQFLAENFYTIAGAGTGSVGTGDPTLGVYTALNNVFGAYTTAHTASSSTVAGSFASGLSKAFMALANRARYPDAVVVDGTTFWTAFAQGSDNAGFWMSELLGAGFQIGPDNTLRWRGVPIYYDINLGTAATTKIAIAGEWKALKFFRGMEFRIDSTDVAGTRWDQNLVGFRGEEEFGINAYPAVFVGAFQLVTGIIP
jgi:HK97 family phage major capsid protein